MARLLVVDDEPTMRDLLERVLGDHDIVGYAADGDTAIIAWRDLRPDAVILDEMMPARSGMEVAAEILSEAPNETVILFSAIVDQGLVSRAAALGIAACVMKTDVMSLPDVLDAALNR